MFNSSTRTGLLLAPVIAAMAVAAFAGDWPCWRGPDGNGIARESNWSPQTLASPRKLWTANVGRGYSTVSIKDGRLYTMGYDGKSNVVYCFDAVSGKKIWSSSYKCWSGGGYCGPRSTPVVDEGRVYTFSQDGKLHCFAAKSGEVKWSLNLAAEYGAKKPTWGFASSPRIFGKMVIINAGKSGMAFDKKSGRKIWSNGGGVGGYATPVLIKKDGKICVAVFGEKSMDLLKAKTGKLIWSFPWQTKYNVNAADPVFVNGKSFFISSGYGRGCAMISGKGSKLWENRNMSSHFSSPVLIGDHIYGINGNTGSGRLACLSTADGRKKWEKQIGAEMLVAAGKRLLVLTKRGELVIVKASASGYTELAKVRVISPRNKMWTMPVICNGRIYCRNGNGDLVCIDVSK